MLALSALRYISGPAFSALFAVICGLAPVAILIVCFEIFLPSELMASNIYPSLVNNGISLVRYSLFITLGAIHIIICSAITFISMRNMSSKLQKHEVLKVLLIGTIIPFVIIVSLYILFCAYKSNLYLISFERVVNAMKYADAFQYQFSICDNNLILSPFCSSGNLHMSIYSFILVIFGLIATLSSCADIGVSRFHHSRKLTPKRLSIAGNEMKDDMNRHAASLLLALASSSVALSTFQQIGLTLYDPLTSDFSMYLSAGQTTSLFWPIAFGSVFIGIFSIPALTILEKRVEALRLLDTEEIKLTEYEKFFAVKQVLPQSLRWAVISGVPLAISFAPKLVGVLG